MKQIENVVSYKFVVDIHGKRSQQRTVLFKNDIYTML